MSQNENLIGILKTIYQHRKYIIGITALAAILSIGISLCLDNYYKSTTIFYAASPDLAKPSPVGPVEQDMDFYGEDEDLDRLFSISQSREVMDYLVNKYDLYTHYDIDSTHEKGPFRLKKKFESLYQTKKTKFNALELTVEDKDRTLATNMANDARDKIAFIAQRLVKRSQDLLLENYKNNIISKELLLDQLNDSLSLVRARFGVYNTTSQGDIISDLLSRTQSRLLDNQARLSVYKKRPEQYRDSIPKLNATIYGLQKQMDKLDMQSSLFNEGLSKVVSLEYEQKELTQQLSLDKERGKQLRSAYQSPFSALHLVETAAYPVVKSWPKRSILVIGSTAFAFILSVLGVLFFNAYKQINWKEITDD